MNLYLGIIREVEKKWGKEHTLSLSEKDLQTCMDNMYKGWVKIGMKMRKERDGDKVGYGAIFVPDNAVKSAQGQAAPVQDESYFKAPAVKEKASEEPDLSESLSDDLPFD